MRSAQSLAFTMLLLSTSGLSADQSTRHGFRLDFTPSETFRCTQIYRQLHNLAYAYDTSHAAADADGAPNAYNPADIGKNCQKDAHVGLDCPSNAGYGTSKAPWWSEVLVPDPTDPSKAYVQKQGTYKGFFVAQTSLKSEGGDIYDPASYVDATKVPYVVIPSGFEKLHAVAQQGDVGIATDLESGASTTFIVADFGGGGDAKLGEASIAFYAALGFPNANPRTGSGLPSDTIQYVLFPGSHRAEKARWPRTNEDIHDQVMALLTSTPGIHK